jgi:hypothetical protein
MPILHLWIVRNPTVSSILADVLFHLPVDDLGDYAVGAGVGTWKAECHTLWLDEAEATADAQARLRAVRAGLHLVRRADGRVVGVRVPGRETSGSG